MPKPPTIFLQSTLTTVECLARIQENTDHQQRTMFSFSGYKGTKPVLSRIDGYGFRLQKRRYYRNDFAPNFYGKIIPWGSASRIEGRFGPPEWARIFLWFWIGFLLLVGLPIAGPALSAILKGNAVDPGAYLGIAIPFSMVLFALFLPRLGDWIGRNEKAFLLDFMETTLAARRENIESGSMASPISG